MVVFKDGRPYKSAYRQFKIKGFSSQDDYHSITEELASFKGLPLDEAQKILTIFIPIKNNGKTKKCGRSKNFRRKKDLINVIRILFKEILLPIFQTFMNAFL